ncbi:MAG: mercuric transporter MerT family protein [Parvularcula sp.]
MDAKNDGVNGDLLVTQRSHDKSQGQHQGKRRGKRWLATGGIVGALLASSCCILPLVLVSLGVSGAWIGSLTALDAYKPIFIGIAAVFIAAGFRRVYFQNTQPCDDQSACARPSTARLTKAALWISAILVLLAATVDQWAPLFY